MPPPRVATREALLAWTQDPGAFRAALTAFFDPFWSIEPLSSAQVDRLRAVIHPEIRISPPPRPAAVATAKDEAVADPVADLKVLDRRQEANARRILAAYLKSALAVTTPTVKVGHFDAWARDNGVSRKDKEDSRALGQRLLAKLEGGEAVDSGYYQSVLIDEAQDFEASWFQCVLAAMEEPLDGDLLIVGDGSQGLYGQRPFTWRDVGVQAQGRTINLRFDLDKNYRNSREIVELAALFATAPPGDDVQDGVGALQVDPAKCPRTTGIKPLLLSLDQRVLEFQQVTKLVKERLDGYWQGQTIPPVAPHDIAILYPWLSGQEKPLLRELLKGLKDLTEVVWLSDPDDRRARTRVGDPGVKVQTIHSAKGLQYKAVILMALDHLPTPFDDSDEATDARLLYVGLTRPEDYLALTASRSSAFVERIARSGKVVVI
ncbi:MAG: 3'-5' exonuclease [Candidatus Competibacterales bacterium]